MRRRAKRAIHRRIGRRRWRSRAANLVALPAILVLAAPASLLLTLAIVPLVAFRADLVVVAVLTAAAVASRVAFRRRSTARA